jgi:inosine-uridine nucleoside N-ribohydrolase
MTRPTIVLDCDPGIDDALALLVASRYANLLAITTVNGNVDVDKTTRNALAVAQLAGLAAEVHRGNAEPLVPNLIDAAHVHGANGLGPVDIDEHLARAGHAPRTPAGHDAVGFLLEITRARRDIHLVAVGPLTNVAMAMRRDPDFASRLASLTIMGGSSIGGNVTAAGEFNIFVDPEAAAIVLDAGVRPRLVTLDVTTRVTVGQNEVAQLRAAATTTSRFVADALGEYQRVSALHDPCAVLAVTHPELFGFVGRRVDVELDGRHTRGMTIIDHRLSARGRNHNVLVGTSVDAVQVLRMIIDATIDPIGLH